MMDSSRRSPSAPRKGGGDSEDAEATNRDIEDIDNWVLVSIDSWVRSGLPKDDVIEKIMSSVSLHELRDAAQVLRGGKWGEEMVRVPQEGDAEYSRNLAGAVYKGLLSIQNSGTLKVKFWVSSNDLLKVPGARQYLEDGLDAQAVGARLAGVDAQIGLMMDRLKAAENLEATVTELARTVTALKDELKDSRKVNQEQCGNLKGAASAFEKAAAAIAQAGPRQSTPGHTWADRVAGSQSRRQSRVRSLQSGANRDRSISSKRGLEGEDLEENASRRPRVESSEELRNANAIRASHAAPSNSALSQSLAAIGGFVEVKRRKRGFISRGASTVEADGGEKPPYSVFLSGTSTSTTDAIVKEKLCACYAALSSEDDVVPRAELKVLKVENIPLKIPQGETPRSRCWKVTVAPEFEEHMARGEAYPQAWGWRKWNPGPRTFPGTSSAADGRA